MQIKQKWCWGQEHSHCQDKMQMENLFTVAKNQNTQQEQYSLCKCINMMQFSQAMRQWDRSFIYSLLQLHTLPLPPPPTSSTYSQHFVKPGDMCVLIGIIRIHVLMCTKFSVLSTPLWLLKCHFCRRAFYNKRIEWNAKNKTFFRIA